MLSKVKEVKENYGVISFKCKYKQTKHVDWQNSKISFSGKNVVIGQEEEMGQRCHFDGLMAFKL